MTRAADMLRKKLRYPPPLALVGKFLVEIPTPSANQVQRWLRKSPWRYTKCKNQLSEWVMVASTHIPKAKKRRHLVFIRSYKSERHRLDDDNLVGGIKPLRDACTHYGIIRDDSAEHATFEYHQVKQTDGSDWVEVGVFEYA